MIGQPTVLALFLQHRDLLRYSSFKAATTRQPAPWTGHSAVPRQAGRNSADGSPQAHGIDSPTLLIRRNDAPAGPYPVFEHVYDALQERSRQL